MWTRVADLLQELHTEARVETPVFTGAQSQALGLDQFGDGPINFTKYIEIARLVLGPRHANETDTLEEALLLFQGVYGELLETLSLPTSGLWKFCTKMRVGMKAAGLPVERRLAYASLVVWSAAPSTS